MSKISIITPVYENDLHFVSTCAESLKEQLYTDYEWLLITSIEEKTLKNELTSIESIDYRVISDPSISSVSVARNRGIEEAAGEYIYFLDCDDFLYEHTLFCLMETMEREKSELVVGPIKRVNTKPGASIAYRTMLTRMLESRDTITNELKVSKYRSSCLNILYNLAFVRKHHFQFDSAISLLSDPTFTMPAYEQAIRVLSEPDAFYLKRRRNDPINFPSLSQRLSSDKAYFYALSFEKTIKLLNLESETSKMLSQRFLKAYHFTYLRDLYIADSNKGKTLQRWAEAFNQIKQENLRFSRSYHKREISFLQKGHYAAAEKLAKVRMLYSDISRIIKKPSTFKRTLYAKVMSKSLSVKPNWILYESFLGRNYSDSPKYIYEYLEKEYPGKYKHIWVFDQVGHSGLKSAVQVKRFSFKHMYYMARTKFLVNNMRQPKWYRKRNEQIFLETWHGTPLKKLVFDMEDIHSANPNYKQDFFDQSRAWDYLVSANRYSTEIFKRAFLFDNKMLEHGYPRNDLLYHPEKETIANNLKEKLGIPTDRKIVLYAPTWRDDDFYKPGQYKFKLKLDLKRIQKELGDEYFFVLRTHYFIADHLDTAGFENSVYNASKYDDITELYLIADVLITDYSSVFFDYANLKRPILFFTYDLEKYRDTLRGFYLDLETEGPGPLIMNNDELINALTNLPQVQAKYEQRLQAFHHRFCDLDDGQASKRVSEEVIVSTSRKS